MLLDAAPSAAGSSTSVRPVTNSGLTFYQAVLLAFALFVGVAFFSFEDVANWLGILCWLGGAAFTFKLASDQERSLPAWTLPSLFLGPVAAVVLLAFPPQAAALPTRFGQLRRSTIALSSLPLTLIVVFALTAATGQGPFKVLKASDVSFGFTPRISDGPNLCGKTVNVDGTVIDVYASGGEFAFALSDPTGQTARIIANKQLPAPQNGQRVRERALVTCNIQVAGTFMYTLVELTRRQTH